MRRFLGRAIICAAFVCLIPLLLFAPVRGQDTFSGRVVEVLSGDEMRVRLDAFEVIVHLHGVDAPLTPPRLKERARQYVARRVEGTTIRVEVRGTGPRKLIYGEVFPVKPDNGSLNQELIRIGLGTWAKDFAPQRDDLAEWEASARASRRGLWGDVSGENVPLPPPAAEATGNRQQATGKDAAVGSRQSAVVEEPRRPTPNARRQTPTTADSRLPTAALNWEDRFQQVRKYLRSAYAPPGPGKAFPPMWPVLVMGFATAGGLGLAFLFGAGRFRAGSLPFQVLCAAFVGVAGACLLPLPLLFMSKYLPYSRDAAVTAVCLPLGVWLWRRAMALFRRDQILRATPRYPIADAPFGLVRVSGEASAPNGTVKSFSGKLPAIYLREVTYRYSPRVDAKYDRSRNSLPHHWELLRDEVKAADFVIEDESGRAVVLADKAEFHPLRVARYYNDVPVEKFPDPPYGGDTRTHIYFLPERAEVTAWGRRYQSSSPLPGKTEERLGYDTVADCLIVAEGTPSRLYTRRPLLGLLCVILALTAFGIVAYCLLTPEDLPPIRLTVSEYVKTLWEKIGR